MEALKPQHTKYIYRVYGLIIESEIQLPELIEVDNGNHRIDLKIFFGPMNNEIKKIMENGKNFGFEKDDMWFAVKELATLHVKNGNEIIIESYDNCNIDQLRLHIHGSAFGMILLQRNLVTIHGSAIAFNEKAIILSGNSGAGKSTLSAALKNKGFYLLSDDIAVIDNNKLTVRPGFPSHKLCADAMYNLGYNVNEHLRINDDKNKYTLTLNKSFSEEPVKVQSIFELSIGKVQKVEIKKIAGAEKLKLIINNIYLNSVIKFCGMRRDYFQKCIDIANKMDCYKITRPEGKFSVNEQMEIILKILNGEKIL